MSEKVRIAVVGAGRMGTPMLENFLEFPYVELVGVADKNPNSPGALLAKHNGIYFTEDFRDLAQRGDDIDVLVEVTGDPTVKPALKEAFQAQDNRHTILCHDLLARLILSMATGSTTLVETLHPADEGIG
jgi:predicted dehydrogenase